MPHLLGKFRYCAPVSPGTGLMPARNLAKIQLKKLGAGRVARAEILLIINELANNIIRHGGSGDICMFPVVIGAHSGFFIRATDSGPGISDVDKAFMPGESEDNGLGLGLNAIKNLSDDVKIASGIKGGARVDVWKWLT